MGLIWYEVEYCDVDVIVYEVLLIFMCRFDLLFGNFELYILMMILFLIIIEGVMEFIFGVIVNE